MNDDKPKRYRRWALKTSRDIASGVVKVYPVAPAPKGLEPYAMRRSRAGLVETLQIFDNHDKAKQAHQDETLAAALVLLGQEETYARVAKAVDRLLQDFGISRSSIAALLDVPYGTVAAVFYRKLVAPRLAAKILILEDQINQSCKRAKEALPEAASTGNPAMSRGGNPDIWKTRRRQQTAE